MDLPQIVEQLEQNNISIKLFQQIEPALLFAFCIDCIGPCEANEHLKHKNKLRGNVKFITINEGTFEQYLLLLVTFLRKEKSKKTKRTPGPKQKKFLGEKYLAVNTGLIEKLISYLKQYLSKDGTLLFQHELEQALFEDI